MAKAAAAAEAKAKKEPAKTTPEENQGRGTGGGSGSFSPTVHEQNHPEKRAAPKQEEATQPAVKKAKAAAEDRTKHGRAKRANKAARDALETPFRPNACYDATDDSTYYRDKLRQQRHHDNYFVTCTFY